MRRTGLPTKYSKNDSRFKSCALYGTPFITKLYALRWKKELNICKKIKKIIAL